MKPAPFKYAAPTSAAAALALLAEHGLDAKVLAGGQSLVPLLNFRLARPQVIIDINRIRALTYIRHREGVLRIGALTRQAAAEHSPVVRRVAPLLREALGLVGHPQIRNRGTVGGSIAHADPSAELPAVLAALDGEVVVHGPSGERVHRSDEFFTGYLTTALEPVDLLTEVRFPMLPRRAGTAFLEIARRHGDYALVGVAAVVRREDGVIAEARIAFTGVGPTPVRAREVEAQLRGTSPSAGTFAEAGRAAAGRLDPEGDIHATAEYRREVASVLAGRALETAWARTRTERTTTTRTRPVLSRDAPPEAAT